MDRELFAPADCSGSSKDGPHDVPDIVITELDQPTFLASTGLDSLDRLLGSDGYPDRSTVLVVGPPGIGKEALRETAAP